MIGTARAVSTDDGAVGRSVEVDTRRQKPFGVAVLRGAENGLDRAGLDNFAPVHHGDAVADLRGDAEVVGDKHHAAAVFGAELEQQVENLGLHRHVEGGGGFVGDDERGVAGERKGNHDALAKPAGELVGERAEAGLRIRDAHVGKQPENVGTVARNLGKLVADGHSRVERGHGVLENRANVLFSHHPVGFGSGSDNVDAHDLDAARDLRLRVVGQQAHHAEPEHTLAGSRFAHEPEDLAGSDVEAHAAHRRDGGSLTMQGDPQVAH